MLWYFLYEHILFLLKSQLRFQSQNLCTELLILNLKIFSLLNFKRNKLNNFIFQVFEGNIGNKVFRFELDTSHWRFLRGIEPVLNGLPFISMTIISEDRIMERKSWNWAKIFFSELLHQISHSITFLMKFYRNFLLLI